MRILGNSPRVFFIFGKLLFGKKKRTFLGSEAGGFWIG